MKTILLIIKWVLFWPFIFIWRGAKEYNRQEKLKLQEQQNKSKAKKKDDRRFFIRELEYSDEIYRSEVDNKFLSKMEDNDEIEDELLPNDTPWILEAKRNDGCTVWWRILAPKKLGEHKMGLYGEVCEDNFSIDNYEYVSTGESFEAIYTEYTPPGKFTFRMPKKEILE